MKQQLTPASIAENDNLRSAAMRRLIQSPATPQPAARQGAIPPVLVQFWDNLATLPTDVQHCLDSWEPLTHQGFSRHLFDEPQAFAFITASCEPGHAQAFLRCTHPAMKCDYFRLCYLYYHGGFYVDADERYQGADCRSFVQDGRLKIQPLCYDTRTDEMVSAEVFMRQRRHADEWIYYVNNNPLIAPARHPVIGRALARATRQLLQSTTSGQSIQSIAGPGNLTASLVMHALAVAPDAVTDFCILPNWDAVSVSPWPLSYRNDERNWRVWEANQIGHHPSFTR